MKNNLERFIKNNFPAFDEEPASGHYERWQAKRAKARRRTKLLVVSQLAAAACLAAVVTVLVNDRTPATPQGTIVLCENAADMKSCYLSKMNDVAEQIREVAETLDGIDPQEVMIEVDNLLATGGDIELEIPDELPDDAAKAMRVNYYQQHLESLQSIAELLVELKVKS